MLSTLFWCIVAVGWPEAHTMFLSVILKLYVDKICFGDLLVAGDLITFASGTVKNVFKRNQIHLWAFCGLYNAYYWSMNAFCL